MAAGHLDVPAHQRLSVLDLQHLSFYYFIGTSIEEYWGTAKFTLFYLACAVLMVVFGMISILWSPLPVVSSGNLNQILFLAFATLYPDALIRVYLILASQGQVAGGVVCAADPV